MAGEGPVTARAERLKMPEEASSGVSRLLREEAALRRVATLVAQGRLESVVLEAVVAEAGALFSPAQVRIARYSPDQHATIIGGSEDGPFPIGSHWALGTPSVFSSVLDSGRVARCEEVTERVGPTVGAPIVVGGATWGALVAVSRTPELLSGVSEARLVEFAELVASAITNVQSREELHALAEAQGSLRRVATLVADGAEPRAVFTAVAVEAARLLGVGAVSLLSYDTETEMFTKIYGTHGDRAAVADGLQMSRADCPEGALLLESGKPVRLDDWTTLPGQVAANHRAQGFGQAVAAPVIVDGSIWGQISAFGETGQDLPPGSETRLAEFTHLVSTSISNAQAREALMASRGRVEVLAQEQAALRRVATLVAVDVGTSEILEAVVREARQLLGASSARLYRYEGERSATVIAGDSDPGLDIPVGTTVPLEGENIPARVWATARAARLDNIEAAAGPLAARSRQMGIAVRAGAPISVEGRLWGVLVASWDSRLALTLDASEPITTEARLYAFTELVATAISNAESRDQVRQLLDEQEALRRVATLVAEGADSAAVFDAVCAETGRLTGATSVNLNHYTPDGVNLTLAGWSLHDTHLPVGTRLPLAPDTVGDAIPRAGAPARIDSYEGASSELAMLVRERGIRSSVGVPVIVEGRPWGDLTVGTDRDEPMPVGTELRVARFTELVATAISNTDARAQLIASRARIVTAGDEARRRIERNLHDGTQQRLLALGLDLQRIRSTIPADQLATRSGLKRAERDLESMLEDVRELSRGLHPALLSRGGLRPALRALARRSPIPVDMVIDLASRPSPAIETAAYYLISEALTNAIKHSSALAISIKVATDPADLLEPRRHRGSRSPSLRAVIADDGIGGAKPTEGSGLAGAVDRVEALGGGLTLDSGPGRGTTVSIELPFAPPAGP